MTRAVRFALALGLGLGCRAQQHARPDGGWDGKSLFEQVCAPCHGTTGKGDTQQGRAVGAKDLTRDEARRLRDDEIAHQIRVGKGKMPAFAGALDEDQIAAIVAHVRRIQSTPR